MNRASETSGTFIKVSNIQVTGAPERKETALGTEKILEKIIAETSHIR